MKKLSPSTIQSFSKFWFPYTRACGNSTPKSNSLNYNDYIWSNVYHFIRNFTYFWYSVASRMFLSYRRMGIKLMIWFVPIIFLFSWEMLWKDSPIMLLVVIRMKMQNAEIKYLSWDICSLYCFSTDFVVIYSKSDTKYFSRISRVLK